MDQVPGYSEMSIYDKPSVLAAMLLNNQVTARGLRNLAFNSDLLSPLERRDLGDMVATATGLGDMGRVGVGVAKVLTNPWIWLGFIPMWGPSAHENLRKGGSLLAKKADASVWARENMGALSHMGMLTPGQEMDGTGLIRVGMQFKRTVEGETLNRNGRLESVEAPLLRKLSAIHGQKLKSLDPNDYAKGSARHTIVTQFLTDLALHFLDATNEVTRNVPSYEYEFESRRFRRIRKEKSVGSKFGVEYIEEFDDPVRIGLDATMQGMDSQKAREHVFKAKVQFYKELRSKAIAEKTAYLKKNPGDKKVRVMDWREYATDVMGVEVHEPRVKETRTKVEVHRRAPILTEPDQVKMFQQNIESYGQEFQDYVEAHRKLTEETAVKMFLDEGKWRAASDNGRIPLHQLNIADVVDDQKLVNLYASAADGIYRAEGGSPLMEKDQGKAFIARMFGDYEAALFEREGVSFTSNYKAWRGKLLHALTGSISGTKNYLPFNASKPITPEGVRLPTDRLEKWSSFDDVLPGDRVVPVTSNQADQPLHPDFIKQIFSRYGKNDRLRAMEADMNERATKYLAENRKPLMAFNPENPMKMLDNYYRNMTDTHALHIMPPDEGVKHEWRRVSKQHEERVGWAQANAAKEMAKAPGLDDTFTFTLYDREAGDFEMPRTLGQMMQEGYYRIHPDNQVARDKFRDVWLPAMMGRGNVKHHITRASFYEAKAALRSIADGAIGRHLESYSWGKDFVENMRRLSQPETQLAGSGGVSGALAKYMYVTHLGLNMASVAMNMMQPLVMAGSAMGVKNVLKAYGSVIGEVMDYTKKRVSRYGFKPISELERQELIHETFHFGGKGTKGKNVIGIGSTEYATLDSMISHADREAKHGLAHYLLFEVPMKMFEKSEWVNRSVTAHAVKNAYMEKGKSLDHPDFLYDVQGAVERFQFASTEMNTPEIFQNSKNSLTGRLMTLSPIRQFLSFNLRSMTGALYDVPGMGERDFGQGFTQSWMKGMAVSALIYESAKAVLGVDTSPGLMVSSSLGLLEDVVQPGQKSDTAAFRLPPVIDSTIQAARGWVGEDYTMLANGLARWVPGGVALSRALGVAPNVNDPLLGVTGALQKTFADWSRPNENGEVPVYKSDGTLIGYFGGSELILRGMGADLNKFSAPGKLDNYLTNQREEIVRYRKRLLDAQAGNDMRGVEAVRAEFEKRFGMPLTVTKQQLQSYIKTRDVPRTERILDRLPTGERTPYLQMVASSSSGNALGLPESAILAGSTAKSRDPFRTGAPAVTLEQIQGAQDGTQTGP